MSPTLESISLSNVELSLCPTSIGGVFAVVYASHDLFLFDKLFYSITIAASARLQIGGNSDSSSLGNYHIPISSFTLTDGYEVAAPSPAF